MTLKLSVIGCGYLGATHAACMSSLGFEVVGIDTDQNKVDLLFSSVKDADVHFICVGTPQSKDGLAADLTYVKSSVAAIAPYLKDGALVVGKSTVPVGTAQLLREQLAASAPQADLAWNPEFLREGFAVEDTLTPNRLVVGVANDRAEEILKDVYKPVIDLGTPWIRADLPTAELVKVAANSFLATKISFINAMAEVCEAAGGDVTVLAKAIGYDPRIGSRFLQAGIGFGGGCLPKDIRAFMARAQELGADQALEFLREIDAINLRARQRVIDVVRADLSEDLTQYKIAVLGATFKPDSDDVRDSPALDIAAQLQAAGAQVVVHDPKGIEPARKRFPNLDYQEKIAIADAVKGADAILHLTEWKEYRELDPSVIGQLVKSKFLIDGRNMLDRNLWRAAGWRVHALGRTD